MGGIAIDVAVFALVWVLGAASLLFASLALGHVRMQLPRLLAKRRRVADLGRGWVEVEGAVRARLGTVTAPLTGLAAVWFSTFVVERRPPVSSSPKTPKPWWKELNLEPSERTAQVSLLGDSIRFELEDRTTQIDVICRSASFDSVPVDVELSSLTKQVATAIERSLSSRHDKGFRAASVKVRERFILPGERVVVVGRLEEVDGSRVIAAKFVRPAGELEPLRLEHALLHLCVAVFLMSVAAIVFGSRFS